MSDGGLINVPIVGGGARNIDPALAQYGLPLTLIPDPDIPQYIPDPTSGNMVRSRPGHIHNSFLFFRNDKGLLDKKAVEEGDIDPLTGMVYARHPDSKQLEMTRPHFKDGKMYLFRWPEGAKPGFRPGDAILNNGTPLFVFDSNANAFVYAAKGQYIGKGVQGERDEAYASTIKAYIYNPGNDIVGTPGTTTDTEISLKGEAKTGWLGLGLSQDEYNFDPKGGKWELKKGDGRILGNGLKPTTAVGFCPHIARTNNNRINREMSVYSNSARVGWDKKKGYWRTPENGDVYAAQNSETGNIVYLTDSDKQTPNEMDYGQGNPPAVSYWSYGRLVDRIDGAAARDCSTIGMMVYGDPKQGDDINVTKTQFTKSSMSLFRGFVSHDTLDNDSRTSVPMTNQFFKSWTLDISLNRSAWKRAGIAARITGFCLAVGAAVGIGIGFAVAAPAGIPVAIAIGIGSSMVTSLAGMFAQNSYKVDRYKYILGPEIRLRSNRLINEFNKSDMVGFTEIGDAIKYGINRLATKFFIASGGVDGEQKFHKWALSAAGICVIAGALVAASAAILPALIVPLIASGVGISVGLGGSAAISSKLMHSFSTKGGANLLKRSELVSAPIKNNEYPGSDWTGHRTAPSSNLLIDPFAGVISAVKEKYGVKPDLEIEEAIQKMQNRLKASQGQPVEKEAVAEQPRINIGQHTSQVLEREAKEQQLSLTG